MLEFLAIALVLQCVSSDVIKLNDETFFQTTTNEYTLVKFFSPNCGHCNRMSPAYEELGKKLAQYSHRVKIAEVNCMESKAACLASKVDGYPTIIFYRKNMTEPEEYKGDRSVNSFMNFLSTRIGLYVPSTKTSVEELNCTNFNDIVMDSKKNVLVSFTAPWCGHCKALKPSFEEASSSFFESDNVVLANIDTTIHTECTSSFNIEGFPTLYFFPAYDTPLSSNTSDSSPTKGGHPLVRFSGDRSAAGIVSWINNATKTTFRALGGGVMETAGVEHEELRNAIKTFVHALTETPMTHIETITPSPTAEENSTELQTKTITTPPPPLADARDVAQTTVNRLVRSPRVSELYHRYLKASEDPELGLTWIMKELERHNSILSSESAKRGDVELLANVMLKKNILALFSV